MQSKVFVAVPNLGKLRTGLVNWLMICNENFISDKVPIQGVIYLPINRPIEVNRNGIVKEFLKSDCTHLLMVDSDIMPSKDLIPRFLKYNKDVIGGYVPIWHPKLRKPTFFAFKKINNEYQFVDSKLGFQECDFVGSGIMMIKREVIEALPKPLFKQVFDQDVETVLKGEDQRFCEYAKENGFKIYVDCTSIESQAKEIDLIETLDIVKTTKEQVEKNIDLTKFKDKLFIGRQQKTEDGLTLDIIGDPDVRCDISKGIPLNDNSHDYIEIHHLLEHFDNDKFLEIIKELHRVSKPNGIIDIKVPNETQGFSDPTHKMFFKDQTFLRLTKKFWNEYGSKCWYNDKFFKITSLETTSTEIHVILKTDKVIEVIQ